MSRQALIDHSRQIFQAMVEQLDHVRAIDGFTLDEEVIPALVAGSGLSDGAKAIIADEDSDLVDFHQDLTCAIYPLALDKWFLDALVRDQLVPDEVKALIEDNIQKTLVADVTRVLDEYDI